MPRPRGKTLKETILELLSKPMSVDELVKEVKKKKPRTRVRVIKALVSRLKKEGAIKEFGGKYQKA